MKLSDRIMMNDSYSIPCVGYGTWRIPPECTRECVIGAVKAGYRHIDTAKVYRNEEGVGEGVRECGIPREELFVTSKLWNADRGYDSALRAFDATMERLGMDYLDLYLIHWPAVANVYGEGWSKVNADTWKALERLKEEGRVRSIGVSNFLEKHLQRLSLTANIPPAIDQIEIHPGFSQRETVEFCKRENICVEAWSPLAKGAVFRSPELAEIAKKHGRSIAQVCLRWILQQGVIPLTRSQSEERIRENSDIFGFELSAGDCAVIDAVRLEGKWSDPETMTE